MGYRPEQEQRSQPPSSMAGMTDSYGGNSYNSGAYNAPTSSPMGNWQPWANSGWKSPERPIAPLKAMDPNSTAPTAAVQTPNPLFGSMPIENTTGAPPPIAGAANPTWQQTGFGAKLDWRKTGRPSMTTQPTGL